MKKLFSLMLLLATIVIALPSCSGDKDEPTPTTQEVEVKLDYSLFESGSMSRSGESVYQKFYDEYIKTKILTPKTYSLVFVKGSKYTMKVSGTWDSNDAIKLLEGEYAVTGTSAPTDAYVSDVAYLNFNENVSIAKDTEKVTLRATYDCFLLMFDASTIETASWKFETNTGTNELFKVDNLYYMFVYQTYSDSERRDMILNIKRNNGATIELNITNMGLSKGKYYYFNNTTNSFDIDPMENGNQ